MPIIDRTSPAPRAKAARCSVAGHLGPPVLADAQQLDLERQFGVRRDDAGRAPGAVAQSGRDDELALAADLHAGHALVPALDDPTGAELKGERLAAVEAGGELFPVGEPAG